MSNLPVFTAVLTLDGAATVDGTPLKPGPLLHLGDGRTSLRRKTPEKSWSPALTPG